MWIPTKRLWLFTNCSFMQIESGQTKLCVWKLAVFLIRVPDGQYEFCKFPAQTQLQNIKMNYMKQILKPTFTRMKKIIFFTFYCVFLTDISEGFVKFCNSANRWKRIFKYFPQTHNCTVGESDWVKYWLKRFFHHIKVKSGKKCYPLPPR